MSSRPGPGRSRGDRDAASVAAEAEVERDYGRLEAEVLSTVRGKLATSGGPIDDGVLEAAYNQAWHALYAARAGGEEISNRTGFLVQVAYRRALDEQRARWRGVATPVDAADTIVSDPDLEGAIDDRLRLRALSQGLRERLDDRELRAATLCYLQGYTRPEAARALGIRPRRFEKIMDRVSRKLGELVGDLRAGEWCDSRRSLIAAYALGMLERDGDRHRLASEHLEDCPACRRRVLCMRGLASVTPPLPLLAAGAASGGAGTTAAGELAQRATWLSRAGGHWMEIGAGGAVAAVAATAVVVVGPPGGGSSSPSAPAAEVSAAPPARPAAKPRGATSGKTVRKRSDKRRRQAARDRTPAAPTPTQPPAVPAVAAAPPQPEPTPPPPVAEQPPATPPPADDGWEEFELRR